MATKKVKRKVKTKKKVASPLNKFLERNKLSVITAYIPKTLHVKIKAQAKKNNEFINNLINRALEKEIKR